MTRSSTTLSCCRSATLFEPILNYYLTGALHLPIHVCKWQFKAEMDFWQIPRDITALCCQKRLPDKNDFVEK